MDNCWNSSPTFVELVAKRWSRRPKGTEASQNSKKYPFLLDFELPNTETMNSFKNPAVLSYICASVYYRFSLLARKLTWNTKGQKLE